MKRIAIVTATRAEYGLLSPLIRRVHEDDELELNLIVMGGHLSDRQGMTVSEIVADRFPIAHKIPILSDDNTPYGISIAMANAISGFAKCFREDRPDMVVILGDRTEMLSVAAAAMNERIPIAHIHGGEVTEGAVDDCVRHALTKMSYLHFTCTEVYRNRVIQMGEDPDRVFNVGALGAENILNSSLMSESELREDVGIPGNSRYAVVTFHPVTLEYDTVSEQVRALCDAMNARRDIFFIITGANADAGGNVANELLSTFADVHSDQSIFIQSLGMKRYLSAAKYAEFVLGNSSSGILEAPVLGTPTVNIGDRQKGRLMPESVVCCGAERSSIVEAIDTASSMSHTKTDVYGDGTTSKKIIAVIKDYLLFDRVNLKKGFYVLDNINI